MKEFVEHGGRGERSGRSDGREFADGRRGESCRIRCWGVGEARAGDCAPPGAGLGWGVRGSSRGNVGPPSPQNLGRSGGKVPMGQHGPASLALGPSTPASGRVEQAHPCGELRPSRSRGHPSWHGPRGARREVPPPVPSPRGPQAGEERGAAGPGGYMAPPNTARSRDWHRQFVFSHSLSAGGRTGSPAVRGGP